MKFRVWSKNQNIWIDSCYLQSDGLLYYRSFSHDDETAIFSFNQAPKDFILMRSTEVLDKCGKEIYEGDILKFPKDWFYQFDHIGTVDWVSDKMNVCFMYINTSHPTSKIKCYLIHDMRCEIIGNIYENPELLGGQS